MVVVQKHNQKKRRDTQPRQNEGETTFPPSSSAHTFLFLKIVILSSGNPPFQRFQEILTAERGDSARTRDDDDVVVPDAVAGLVIAAAVIPLAGLAARFAAAPPLAAAEGGLLTRWKCSEEGGCEGDEEESGC